MPARRLVSVARPSRAASTATRDTSRPNAITAALRMRTDVGIGRGSGAAAVRGAGVGRGSPWPRSPSAAACSRGTATGARSQLEGMVLVRIVTPAHRVGLAPRGDARCDRCTHRGDRDPAVDATRLGADDPAHRGVHGDRHDPASGHRQHLDGALCGGTPAPAMTRARSDSVSGGVPGHQATGAGGAMTSRVARVKARNTRRPRHVAERGAPKVLHLVAGDNALRVRALARSRAVAGGCSMARGGDANRGHRSSQPDQGTPERDSGPPGPPVARPRCRRQRMSRTG